MKTIKLIALTAVLALASLSAQSASVTVSNPACLAYSITTAGVDVFVTCGTASPTPIPTPQPAPVPPLPSPRGVPAGCTVVPVTWDERLSLTFHPKFKMGAGQSFAFKKALNPTAQTYASVDYASTGKYMSISRNPCEFTAELEATYCAKGARGNDVSMAYGPSAGFGVCQVGAGDYYINVRNSTTRDGPDNCPAGQECEYYLSW
jgi:hypothetical protein